MIKTVFLVPERDNSGRRFTPRQWRHLEERLLRFGGLSRLAGIRGAWQYQGHTYRDLSRQYTVSLQSWRDFDAWLATVEWAREAFEQEAIYIEVAGIFEILGPA